MLDVRRCRRFVLLVCVLHAIALVGLLGEAAAEGFGSPYRVTDLGATGDGRTLDTAAIQAAIDRAAEGGGGTVFFPPGAYLSGTLFLKSHVRLDLDAGATLLGSPDVEDYPLVMNGYPSRTDRYCARALIRGEGLEDIAITGRGTIDGQGALFRDNRASAEAMAEIKKPYEEAGRYVPNDVFVNRPYVIQLVSCRNVLVEGVRLRNSAMWMQHYLNCAFVTIRGIDVYNHSARNNDMIDIDGCRNVTIADCFGDTDDDALTLKSNGEGATENVSITNCVLRSHCNAIKAGTESYGGFKNITISNCVIETSEAPEGLSGRPEGLAGIALEIVDGGVMDGVTIDNIVVRGTTAPLFIRLGDRARPPRPGQERPPVGRLRNVTITNVVARDAGNVGCAIAGLPGHPIENLTLSNIRMSFKGGGAADSVAEVPENADGYPECTMFGPLPAYGLYVRHAAGVDVRGLHLDFEKDDTRPALACDDVRDLAIDGFQGAALPGAAAQIALVRSSGVLIRGARAAEGADFLRAGPDCAGLTATGNDFSGARRVFHWEAGVDPTVLQLEANRLPDGG